MDGVNSSTCEERIMESIKSSNAVKVVSNKWKKIMQTPLHVQIKDNLLFSLIVNLIRN